MKFARQSWARFIKLGEIVLLSAAVVLFFLAVLCPHFSMAEGETYFWDLFASPLSLFLVIFGSLTGLVVSVLADKKAIGLIGSAILVAVVSVLLSSLIANVFLPYAEYDDSSILFGGIAGLLFVIFSYVLAVLNAVRYFLLDPPTING